MKNTPQKQKQRSYPRTRHHNKQCNEDEELNTKKTHQKQYDDDEELNMTNPTIHLPLLNQDSIKPWLEAVISNIDSNKLASYVEEKVYTQPKYGITKTRDEWAADKNPTFNQLNIFETGPDKNKHRHCQNMDAIFSSLHAAIVTSISADDLLAVKNRFLAGMTIKQDKKITLTNFLDFALDNYSQKSLTSTVDAITTFTSTGFPVPTTNDVNLVHKSFEVLLANLALAHDHNSASEFALLAVPLLLQKLNVTDQDLKVCIKTHLTALNPAHPTLPELKLACRQGYADFLLRFESRCVPEAVASANAVKHTSKSKSKKVITSEKKHMEKRPDFTPCRLQNHGNHDVRDCNIVKTLFDLQRQQFALNRMALSSPKKKSYANVTSSDDDLQIEDVPPDQLAHLMADAHDALADYGHANAAQVEDDDDPDAYGYEVDDASSEDDS